MFDVGGGGGGVYLQVGVLNVQFAVKLRIYR